MACFQQSPWGWKPVGVGPTFSTLLMALDFRFNDPADLDQFWYVAHVFFGWLEELPSQTTWFMAPSSSAVSSRQAQDIHKAFSRSSCVKWAKSTLKGYSLRPDCILHSLSSGWLAGEQRAPWRVSNVISTVHFILFSVKEYFILWTLWKVKKNLFFKWKFFKFGLSPSGIKKKKNWQVKVKYSRRLLETEC